MQARKEEVEALLAPPTSLSAPTSQTLSIITIHGHTIVSWSIPTGNHERDGIHASPADRGGRSRFAHDDSQEAKGSLPPCNARTHTVDSLNATANKRTVAGCARSTGAAFSYALRVPPTTAGPMRASAEACPGGHNTAVGPRSPPPAPLVASTCAGLYVP